MCLSVVQSATILLACAAGRCVELEALFSFGFTCFLGFGFYNALILSFWD